MKLTCKNFLIYRKHTFTFPRQSFILIKGSNGHGKSTLFRALTHVLYGSQRSPYSHYTKTCQVQLEFQHLNQAWTITRRNHPNVLEVTVDDKVYQDSEAEAMIHHYTQMTEDQFRSACCVNEDDASFLKMTPMQRLKFIQSMADDQNSEDIVKVTVILHETQSELKTLERECTIREETCTLLKSQVASTKPPKPSVSRSSLIRQQSELESQCQEYRDSIVELQKEYREAQEIQNQYQQWLLWKQELTELERSFETLSHQRNTIHGQLESATLAVRKRDRMKKRKEHMELTEELDTLLSEKPRPRHPLLDDTVRKQYQSSIDSHRQVSQEHHQYQKYIVQLKHWQALWNQKCKSVGSDQLPGEAFMTVANISLFRKLVSSELKKLDTLRNQYSQLKLKLYEAEKAQSLLVCPVCQSSLALDTDRHLTEDTSVRSSSEDRRKMKHELSILNSTIQELESHTYTSIPPMLDSMEAFLDLPIPNKPPPLSDIHDMEDALKKDDTERAVLDSQTKLYKQRLTQLQRQVSLIHDDEMERQPALLESWDADVYQSLKDEIHSLSTLQSQGQKMDHDHQQMKLKLTQLKKQIGSFQSREIKSLESIHRELENCRISLSDTESTLKDTFALLQQWNQYSKDRHSRKVYLDEKQKLTTLKTEYHRLQRQCQGLEGVLDATREAQILATQELVDAFNDALEVHLEALFDGQLDLVLEGYKKHKTKEEYKPSMTLVGTFGGHTIGNISADLSGGQLQMCTLAIRLAVGDVLRRPFLLMDESLNKLDHPKNYTVMLNYLRSLTRVGSGLQILVISHHGGDGLFDQVIDFDT